MRDFQQPLVVTILQSIINITHSPVSTQSLSYIGQEPSQNREMGGSCSEYSQVTGAVITSVTNNGVTFEVNNTGMHILCVVTKRATHITDSQGGALLTASAFLLSSTGSSLATTHSPLSFTGIGDCLTCR